MSGGARAVVLGPVELRREGGAIALGGPTVRLFFAQLVLAGGRAVPDEQVIEGLWGDSLPVDPGVSLRVLANRVRTAVKPAGLGVERQGHGYALTGAVGSDIDDLAALEPAATADGAEALAATEAALALWRGPALADVRRLPLGARLAVALDHRRDRLVDRRAELLLAAGRGADLLADLQQLVHEDPLDERRWAQLAIARYQAGQSAEAMRTLARARAAIGEVGLEPGPLLLAAEQQVLTHEAPAPMVHRAPPVRAVPVALSVHRPAALHGREGELATIAALVERATTQRRSELLVLLGEAGIGKTALAAEAAAHAAGSGLRVLFGSAAGDVREPLSLLGPALEQAALLAPDALTALDDLDGDRTVGGVLPDPDARRTQLVEAAVTGLGVLAAEQPLLLVLDDLQWADELSLVVLRRLARHPLAGPLAVLALQRTGEPPRTGRRTPSVLLAPLDRPAVAEWLGVGTDDPSVDQATDLTAGVPLLLDQLVRTAPSDRHEAGARLLRDRITSLSPLEREVLLAGAVLGPAFTFDELTALVDLADLELLEHLDQAVQGGFLRADPAQADRFAFVHDLFRDALTEQTVPLRTMRLHAHALDALGADRLGPLAAHHHARAAGTFVAPERRVALAVEAGRLQLAATSFETARATLTEALAEVTVEMPTRVHGTLLVLLARADAAVGDPTAARAHLEQAAELARAAGDIEVEAQAVVARGIFGHRFVPDEPGIAQLTSFLDRLPDTETSLRLAVLRQVGFELINAGRADEGTRVLEEAIGLAVALGDTKAQVALARLLHWRWETTGDVARRHQALAQVEAAAATCGREALPELLALRMVEALHDGRRADATVLIDEYHAEAVATGHPNGQWLGLGARFTVPFLEGNLDRAEAAAALAVARGGELGIGGAPGLFASQQFVLGWVRHDLAGFIDPLRAIVVPGSDLVWRSGLAMALAQAGQDDEARSVLRALLADVPQAGTHWLGYIGMSVAVEAAALVGCPDVPAAALGHLQRRVDDHIVLGTAAMDYGPVARYLGVALAQLDRRAEAEELLERVAADDRSGPIWQDKAAIDLARLRGTTPTPRFWTLGGSP